LALTHRETYKKNKKTIEAWHSLTGKHIKKIKIPVKLGTPSQGNI